MLIELFCVFLIVAGTLTLVIAGIRLRVSLVFFLGSIAIFLIAITLHCFETIEENAYKEKTNIEISY